MIARGRVFAVPAWGDPRIVVISVMVVVVALLVVRDRALMTIGVMQGTSDLCEQHITLKGLLSGSSRLVISAFDFSGTLRTCPCPHCPAGRW